ncbi:PhnB protein [Nitrosomonas ureae]|uniref:PhnB protein n=2 Tax=Nitrosomonas ureae TaxID=44577 RepID=A0A1H2EZE9_9PROT|nr:VOC family protein [Nitrosomonas ureae]ALQ50925.1 hypothetical protein ATY38_06590 [Nitrosomonas ureae]SDU00472.1 PhnB protein [Nitrosomonas ureae]
MPNVLIQPYIMFGGCCEEALEFYRTALDAQIDMLMRFQESPDPTPPGMLPPGFENKVMHASFRIADNVLMASDGCEEGQEFKGFSLSISVTTEAEANRYFSALSNGGQVQMPLAKTFWSPCFGMLTDRFGISWMINVVTTDCTE